MGQNIFDIAPLIYRYLKEGLSEEESIILDKWLKEKEENRIFLDSFKESDKIEDDLLFFEELNVDIAWKKVRKRKTGKRNTKWVAYLSGLAASILLVLGFFFWKTDHHAIEEESQQLVKQVDDIQPGGKKASLILSDGTEVDLTKPFHHIEEKDGTEISDSLGGLNYRAKEADAHTLIYNTLYVPKTGTFTLTLPDGTVVWLNAMSSLKFPVHFLGNERRVFLEGEAYFEVAKDVTKPFLVDVNGKEIKVLGTSFNVNAYADVMTATLFNGAVKVSNKMQSRLLEPGQEARVEQANIAVQKANLAKAMAWKEGDFYFEKDDIQQVMQQLQRWYDFDLQYQGHPADKLYSGNISRQSKLSEVLELLHFVSDNATDFQVDNRLVTVISKPIRQTH